MSAAYICIFFILTLSGSADKYSEAQNNSDSLSYVQLSMHLVEAVRNGNPTDVISQRLAEAKPAELQTALSTENEKKAFWLNVYNAYIQIILQQKPELFKDRNSWFGYNFFSSPQITIAGKELSFDDIEHGIMRRSKIKISLGYLDKWFPDPFVEKFWWNEIDPRIHFALNCGAASCPPVAVYNPERVDEQLDKTTKNYLERTTDYYSKSNMAKVSRLMSWFRGDFGGKEGAIKMLKRYGVIPENVEPALEFKEYDWTLDLGNFQEL